MRIFFDCEFTGLTQYAALISLAFVSEDGVSFYAEFTDYSQENLSSWVKNNVLQNLILNDQAIDTVSKVGFITQVRGDHHFIRASLLTWLAQFDNIELWGDVIAFDWVLLTKILATYKDGQPKFPDNFIIPYPRDLFDLFCQAGHSIHDAWNETRSKYGKLVGYRPDKNSHNALWDARVVASCYDKLIEFISAENNEKIRSGKS